MNENFSLDTKNMSQVAEDCEKLAEEMRELKQTLVMYKDILIETWHGEASGAFQKKFHIVEQQLTDLKDELYEMAESILVAADAYIQQDMNVAKMQDGVTKLV